MMRSEFEERNGQPVSFEEFEAINIVYTWHPSIDDLAGKDQIVKIWKKAQAGVEGKDLFAGMLAWATALMDLEGHRYATTQAYGLKFREIDRQVKDLQAQLNVLRQQKAQLKGEHFVEVEALADEAARIANCLNPLAE